MAEAIAARRATYADVLATPAHLIAEVIDGELYAQPRPSTRHAQAATVLGEVLGPPFRRGRGGPGGWLFLYEPELHLGPEPDIVVPDLAGWRRERMPALPDAAYLTLPPDWLCEVISPSTQAHDRTRKLPLYRRETVPHLWLVDPLAETLEVYRTRRRDLPSHRHPRRRRRGSSGALRRHRYRFGRPVGALACGNRCSLRAAVAHTWAERPFHIDGCGGPAGSCPLCAHPCPLATMIFPIVSRPSRYASCGPWAPPERRSSVRVASPRSLCSKPRNRVGWVAVRRNPTLSSAE